MTSYHFSKFFSLRPRTISAQISRYVKSGKGFTLIETMVAISLLTVSIVAPMSLASQSLASAFYARDQITASYLAQEAIETVRSVRDSNILQNSQGANVDLLNGIPSTTGAPFTVDVSTSALTLCPGGVCPALETRAADGIYGYSGGAAGWSTTNFTRVVTATFIPGTINEIKVVSTVSWHTGSYNIRSVVVTENLYRWINDGSGAN